MSLIAKRSHSSKMTEMNEDISTFGFRGEALCFLSYVSDLQISSKQYQNVPQKGLYSKGENTSLVLCDFNSKSGTIVKAENVFRQNKERKNKDTSTTLLTEMKNLVKCYALQHNKVHFTLKDATKNSLLLNTIYLPVERTEKAYSFLKNCCTLATFDEAAITYSELSIYVQLICTKPSLSKNIPSKQIAFFVNNRLTENVQLRNLINAAYKEHYVFTYFVFISITLPLEKVDMNADRAKSEVLFEGMSDFLVKLKEDLSLILARNKTVYEIKELNASSGNKNSGSSQIFVREDNKQIKMETSFQTEAINDQRGSIKSVEGFDETHTVSRILKESVFVSFDCFRQVVFYQFDMYLYSASLQAIARELLYSLLFSGGGSSILLKGNYKERIGIRLEKKGISAELFEKCLETNKENLERIFVEIEDQEVTIFGLIGGKLTSKDYESYVSAILEQVIKFVMEGQTVEKVMDIYIHGLSQVVTSKIMEEPGELANYVYPLLTKTYMYREGSVLDDFLVKRTDLTYLYNFLERC